MNKQNTNVIATIGIALLTFLIICFSWFEVWNLSLQDAVYQREHAINPDIKIIAIDEKTLERLGQFETWTREPYARLIEMLCEGEEQPKVIGLDILMMNEKGEDDRLLVEACEKYPKVVMASNIIFRTEIVEEHGEMKVDENHIEMAELPFEVLRDKVSVGFVNTVQDSRDNRVRYALLKQGDSESFALTIAKKVSGEKIKFTDEQGIFIDYTSKAGGYETVSMIDVLDGTVPREAFADSIVLVGAEAAGMGDSYATPAENGGQMYGVEIHANIIQGLLEGRSLHYATRWINALICAVLVCILAFLFTKLPIWANVLIAAGVAAGQYFLCRGLDEKGFVINMVGLPIGVLIAAVWSIASKYLTEVMQKRKVIRAFQKYVAPQVVEEIAKNKDYQLRLGGEKRDITVLFVDIRGFTPLCEALSPEQVVDILNEYLDLVTTAIFNHDGTLDKFIGDAAMAVFNAPFDVEDYTYKAVLAAQEIAAGSARIAETFRERFGKEVSYGIGVNCGEAIVGNIGSEFRMDYTAIGDTVNTAARLESNAKPGQILISEAVYDRVKDRMEAVPAGEYQLKGKADKVAVYEVKTGQAE